MTEVALAAKTRSAAMALTLFVVLAAGLLTSSFAAGYTVGYLSGWQSALQHDVLSLNLKWRDK